MKGVKVEDYFPDCELFSSARILMREKDTNSFSDQEIFRLKKNVQKFKLKILNEFKSFLWVICGWPAHV